MWQLYIENTKADIGNDMSAQLSYTIDDIRDFAARNTNFSKTITLPGSATNKKIFGHIFEAGSGNFVDSSNTNINYDFDATRAAKCILLYNQIQVFKGVIRIMEIIVDGSNIEFETAIFGEMGGFITAIGNDKLESLDFSAYNHTYNETAIQNSWTNAPGSGVYYPLIDYGYSTDKISFDITNFKPAFYAKEYIDKIFSAAGYTYSSTFLESDLFKKLFIPYNGEAATLFVTTAIAAYVTSPSYAPPTGIDILNFSSVTSGYLGVTNSNSRFTWSYTDTVGVNLRFAIDWSRTGTVDPTVNYFTIDFLKNGSIISTQNVDMSTLMSGSNVVSFPTTLATGDFVEVQTTVASGVSWTLGFWGTSGFTVEGNPVIQLPISNGDSIEVNSFIPKNIFQKDFFSWIIKMFNLYVYDDKDIANHLIIEPYIDFIDSEVEDWRYKLDTSRPFSYKPIGELSARSYELKYKDDSDYYNELYKKKFNETYGTYFYDTGLEFIEDKKTIEVGFSPTPLVQYAGTDRVISAILKRDSAGVDSVTTSNIRILSRSDANISCSTWYIKDGATTLATLTDYPYSGHLDDPDAPSYDINFGAPQELYFTLVTGYLSANLFNVYWSFYISEITDKDSKLLTGFFTLNASDINNLDFSKPKYINGQLWRLNKINDYSTDNNGESVKCDLLKVIDLI